MKHGLLVQLFSVIGLILLFFSAVPTSGATEYKRSLPLEELKVPLPVPPGSEFTLQRDETFGINPSNGYQPLPTEPNTPMIGITIKPPTEPQK